MKTEILKVKRIVALIIAVILIITVFCGCRQSDRVAYNVSKEADNFNVVRKITVINARTDTIMLELTGCFSIANNAENELEIICKVGEDEYRKDFVYLNEYTCYVVEDLSGADVSSYQYEINIIPQMAAPFTVTSSD